MASIDDALRTTLELTVGKLNQIDKQLTNTGNLLDKFLAKFDTIPTKKVIEIELRVVGSGRADLERLSQEKIKIQLDVVPGNISQATTGLREIKRLATEAVSEFSTFGERTNQSGIAEIQSKLTQLGQQQRKLSGQQLEDSQKLSAALREQQEILKGNLRLLGDYERRGGGSGGITSGARISGEGSGVLFDDRTNKQRERQEQRQEERARQRAAQERLDQEAETRRAEREFSLKRDSDAEQNARIIQRTNDRATSLKLNADFKAQFQREEQELTRRRSGSSTQQQALGQELAGVRNAGLDQLFAQQADKFRQAFFDTQTMEKALSGRVEGDVKQIESYIAIVNNVISENRQTFNLSQEKEEIQQAGVNLKQAENRKNQLLDLKRREIARGSEEQRVAQANKQILRFQPEQLQNFEEAKEQLVAKLNIKDASKVAGKPGFLEPGRLANPETLIQLGFAAAFGGIPSLIGGAIGGATPLGPGGALLGSTLAQAGGQILFDKPISLLKEKQDEFKESGLAFQRSILGISAINEGQSTLVGNTGTALPTGIALRARAKEASGIQLAARAKLLPLGIGGQTEATFVQGIVAALAQRGLQGSPEQIATIAENLAGSIQAQRPSLLDNTQQLLKDIQDVIGGGPQANRTVLSQIIRPALGDIQRGRNIEDIVTATNKLAPQVAAARGADNPVTVLNKLSGAEENLKTNAGIDILQTLVPAYQALTRVLKDPEVVSAITKIAVAFAQLSAVGIRLTAGFIDVGSKLGAALLDPLKAVVSVAGAAAAAITLYTLTIGRSGAAAGAGATLNLATGAFGSVAGAGAARGLTGIAGAALGIGSKLGVAGLGFGTGFAIGTALNNAFEEQHNDEIEQRQAARVSKIISSTSKTTPFAKFNNALQRAGLKDEIEKTAAEVPLGAQISELKEAVGLGVQQPGKTPLAGEVGVDVLAAVAAQQKLTELQRKEFTENSAFAFNESTTNGKLASTRALRTLIPQEIKDQTESLKKVQAELATARSPKALADTVKQIQSDVDAGTTEQNKRNEELAKQEAHIRRLSGQEQRFSAAGNLESPAAAGLGFASAAEVLKGTKTFGTSADLADARLNFAADKHEALNKDRELQSKKEELDKAQKAEKSGVVEDSKRAIDLRSRELDIQKQIEKSRQEELALVVQEGQLIRDRFTKLIAPGIDQATAQGAARFQIENKANLRDVALNIQEELAKASGTGGKAEEREEAKARLRANQIEQFKADQALGEAVIRRVAEQALGIDNGLGGNTARASNRRLQLQAQSEDVNHFITENEKNIARLPAGSPLLAGALDERRRRQLQQTETGKDLFEATKAEAVSKVQDIADLENFKQSQKTVANQAFALGQKFEELADTVAGATRNLKDFDDENRLRSLGAQGQRVAAAQKYIAAGGSEANIDAQTQTLLRNPDLLQKLQRDTAFEELKDTERKTGTFRRGDEDAERRRGLARFERGAERELGLLPEQAKQQRTQALATQLQDFIKAQGAGFGLLPKDLQSQFTTNAESAFKELGLSGSFGNLLNPERTPEENKTLKSASEQRKLQAAETEATSPIEDAINKTVTEVKVIQTQIDAILKKMGVPDNDRPEIGSKKVQELATDALRNAEFPTFKAYKDSLSPFDKDTISDPAEDARYKAELAGLPPGVLAAVKRKGTQILGADKLGDIDPELAKQDAPGHPAGTKIGDVRGLFQESKNRLLLGKGLSHGDFLHEFRHALGLKNNKEDDSTYGKEAGKQGLLKRLTDSGIPEDTAKYFLTKENGGSQDTSSQAEEELSAELGFGNNRYAELRKAFPEFALRQKAKEDALAGTEIAKLAPPKGTKISTGKDDEELIPTDGTGTIVDAKLTEARKRSFPRKVADAIVSLVHPAPPSGQSGNYPDSSLLTPDYIPALDFGSDFKFGDTRSDIDFSSKSDSVFDSDYFKNLGNHTPDQLSAFADQQLGHLHSIIADKFGQTSGATGLAAAGPASGGLEPPTVFGDKPSDHTFGAPPSGPQSKVLKIAKLSSADNAAHKFVLDQAGVGNTTGGPLETSGGISPISIPTDQTSAAAGGDTQAQILQLLQQLVKNSNTAPADFGTQMQKALNVAFT